MSSQQSKTVPPGGVESLPKEQIGELMSEGRERTLSLVEPVRASDMERVHDPLMSPLVWDLGHIAAYEDLWLCGRVAGLAPLRPEVMEVYDATETPRARRGELPYLHLDEARSYMDAVRERSLDCLGGADISGDGERLTAAGFAWEMVIAHENQHNETMLQTLALADAGVYSPVPRPLPTAPSAPDGMVRIDGGPFELGTGGEGFAFDNERPRHRVALPAFEIDLTPVTNGAFMEFVEDGGYRRREHWSDKGWAWRQGARVERPLYWTPAGSERRFDRLAPLDPRLPVMHVSWYEADAYARSRGRRLPSEAEWEKAAAPPSGPTGPVLPWGEQPATTERANLDQTGFGPAVVGAYPGGASAYGVLGLVGDAWEWTDSDFAPYPGFEAFPYEEYSAVFFGGDYKVLRGGSWATRPRLARSSLRNWDYPQRRQLFAGFRCARDAPEAPRHVPGGGGAET